MKKILFMCLAILCSGLLVNAQDTSRKDLEEQLKSNKTIKDLLNQINENEATLTKKINDRMEMVQQGVPDRNLVRINKEIIDLVEKRDHLNSSLKNMVNFIIGVPKKGRPSD